MGVTPETPGLAGLVDPPVGARAGGDAVPPDGAIAGVPGAPGACAGGEAAAPGASAGTPGLTAATEATQYVRHMQSHVRRQQGSLPECLASRASLSPTQDTMLGPCHNCILCLLQHCSSACIHWRRGTIWHLALARERPIGTCGQALREHMKARCLCSCHISSR